MNLIDVAKYYKALPHQDAALKYLQGQIPASVMAEFERIWRTPIAPTITVDNLYDMCQVATKDVLKHFVDPLNAGFAKYGLSTPLRVCHFLAQVLHESAELQYQQEIASGSAYEGRSDLGNTQPGDGVRFKGRGLIQVTGRFNYGQISRDTGVDYVSNPNRLAQLPDCVVSAFWYWNSRKLSELADRDDFKGITIAINGGTNGLEERLGYLNRAKSILLK